MNAFLVLLLGAGAAALPGTQKSDFGEDPAPTLQAAEAAYRGGDLEGAMELYESVLAAEEVAPGPVLYNLGNCARRREQFADAVHFYESALRHEPGAAVARRNLSMLRQERGLPAVRPSALGAAATWLNRLPPRLLLVLVGVAQVAALAGLFRLLRGPGRHPHRLAFLAATGMLLAWLVGGHQVAIRLAEHETAIVLLDRTALRAEPHADLPAEVLLQAGQSVRVRQRSDRWLRVEHDGQWGWIEAGAARLLR